MKKKFNNSPLRPFKLQKKMVEPNLKKTTHTKQQTQRKLLVPHTKLQTQNMLLLEGPCPLIFMPPMAPVR